MSTPTLPVTISITSVAYDATANQVSVIASLPLPSTWVVGSQGITVPVEAFNQRKTLYAVADFRAAFDCLMKEQVKTICGLPDGTESSIAQVNACGGLLGSSTVVVSVDATVETALDAILTEIPVPTTP